MQQGSGISLRKYHDASFLWNYSSSHHGTIGSWIVESSFSSFESIIEVNEKGQETLGAARGIVAAVAAAAVRLVLSRGRMYPTFRPRPINVRSVHAILTVPEKPPSTIDGVQLVLDVVPNIG